MTFLAAGGGADALSVFFEFASLLVGVLGGGVALFTYRHMRRQGSRTWRDEQTRHLIQELIEPVSVRVAILESKVDVFWRNVALDAAKVLHSPDPARRHVDQLLEAFMENRLSAEGRDELKSLLAGIRDHHPGDDIGFPVHSGDQVAAAILLQTMDINIRGD